MAEKLFIKTYGCQMNEYDSSKIADVLKESHGFELASSEEDADMIVLNTCSVREKAQEKVFSELGRLRKLKDKKSGDYVIAVGGCVASQEGELVRRRAPYVDMVFGPQTLHRVPDMLTKLRKEKKPTVDISFPEIEKFDRLPEPRVDGSSALVSIMEGCSKYCSFCVVPYTRGEEISRPFDSVITEVAQLAEKGVREITLLGQNVNDYQGLMHDGNVCDLAMLVNFVAAIDGVDRIRYTTSHPNAFSNNLIQAYADVPELANQLHLPVQAGSDRVLAAMKRGYTVLEFKSKIRKLRKVRPDISISSDIIVGFPGETEDDFMKTMELVQQVDFDGSFSFVYSVRPGTPAASLEDPIPLDQKKQWLAALQERLSIQRRRHSENLVGTTQRVLVTDVSKKSNKELQGRTECSRVVDFPGDSSLIGKFTDVEITDALANSLAGNIL